MDVIDVEIIETIAEFAFDITEGISVEFTDDELNFMNCIGGDDSDDVAA